MADLWDRGEAETGVSGGVRERAKRRVVGQRWGTDMRAWVAQHWAAWFKLGLNRNQNSNETKLISNFFKFWQLQTRPSLAPKIWNKI
jgi:hypothetical protein